MFRKNDVLPSITLTKGTNYAHPPKAPEVLYQEDPAMLGMLDLKAVKIITTSPHVPILEAQREMQAAAVHQLLVTSSDNHLQGVISLGDILGTKPLKILQEKRIAQKHLLVKDVMTEFSDLLTFKADDVKIAKIRNVVASLRASKQQYALVAETSSANDKITIRGLFSSHHLSKHLGQAPGLNTEAANTLAELKQHLGSN